LNANAPNVESLFRIYGIYEGIAKVIREYPNLLIVEMERDDLYCVPLNPWDCMPSFTHERLKAGNELSIETVANRQNQSALLIKFRNIEFPVDDLKRHREVQFEQGTAHIFRHESRWLLIIGSRDEGTASARFLVDNAFAALRKKAA